VIESDETLRTIGQPEWLVHPNLQSLMRAFEDAGQKIYAVGGCVRDTALGLQAKDIDLSTDAHPDTTMLIIKGLISDGEPWKAVPTGIDHGTVTAVPPNGNAFYEITTFRTDIETDGRHATVAFSDDINDDAKRRDFTINAFYADRRGRVLDVVGGSVDLKNRHIRFIGDPAARIAEDYLRILRFFRFTGSHGASKDGIDADGLAACAMQADGLNGVSRERIGMELTRIIVHPKAAPTIGMMEQSGVLARILPGASVATLARLIDLESQISSDLEWVDLPTRLASLGCDEVAARLRLSKAQATKIDLVLTEAGSLTSAHELGYRYGFPAAVHCLLLRWASLLQHLDPAALQLAKAGSNATFPIAAADLMPSYSGQALGDRLKALEAAWIASQFKRTKAELLALP